MHDPSAPDFRVGRPTGTDETAHHAGRDQPFRRAGRRISAGSARMPDQESNMKDDAISIARKAYQAYVDKDRAAIEAVIADDFHFTSPRDNRINREVYLERCWKN